MAQVAVIEDPVVVEEDQPQRINLWRDPTSVDLVGETWVVGVNVTAVIGDGTTQVIPSESSFSSTGWIELNPSAAAFPP